MRRQVRHSRHPSAFGAHAGRAQGRYARASSSGVRRGTGFFRWRSPVPAASRLRQTPSSWLRPQLCLAGIRRSDEVVRPSRRAQLRCRGLGAARFLSALPCLKCEGLRPSRPVVRPGSSLRPRLRDRVDLFRESRWAAPFERRPKRTRWLSSGTAPPRSFRVPGERSAAIWRLPGTPFAARCGGRRRPRRRGRATQWEEI